MKDGAESERFGSHLPAMPSPPPPASGPSAQPSCDGRARVQAASASAHKLGSGAAADVARDCSDVATHRSAPTTRTLPAVGEILAVLSAENYSHVATAGQRWLIRRTLERWEAVLPSDLFIRVHRTAIVRLAAIESLERRTGATSLVRLRGFPQPIRVSRSRELAVRVALAERR